MCKVPAYTGGMVMFPVHSGPASLVSQLAAPP